jgi:PAS domain S-box-containing protein
VSAPPTPITRRRIELRTLAILIAVALGVAFSGFTMLYRMTLEARKTELVEMARAQARIVEAVAKFDAFFYSGDIPGAAQSATLSQIKESHRRYRGFGETGEIVLARRQGSEIVFLLPTRKRDFRVPDPVTFESRRAGPMKLALEGGSGTVVETDHSGAEVLAAYEWLPFLELGLVCKIDLAEVRAPFAKAGLATAGVALLLVLVGVILNSRMVSPLVARILEDTELIREREERYRSLVGNVPGAVFRAELDERRTMLELSDAIFILTGRPASDFLPPESGSFLDIVLPDDRSIVSRVGRQNQPGHEFHIEYRITRADGEVRWLAEWGRVAQAPDGRPLLEGVALDVTESKEAELTLAALPQKLAKYVSPQVYRSIFEGERDVRVGSSRKKLTVFFSDIVGFTAASESMDPEDLSYIVNSYFNRMANVALEHGGTLDKFIGDGVLIFFGDPETLGIEEDARACVRMALAMQRQIEELNGEIARHGIDYALRVHIGVTPGFCTVGNFGSESRMDYTILGRTVNLASRLETAAAPGDLLVSRETWLLVREDFACEPLDPIEVKGFDRPVEVFRVQNRGES